MPIRVRFRLNKVTGEVEEFLVDDQNHSLSEAEHDRIAADIARSLVRNPILIEVAPGAATVQQISREVPDERERSEEVNPLPS